MAARRSVSTRLSLLVSGSAAGIFLVSTLAAYWAASKPFTTRFEGDLTAQTKLLKAIVERFDKSSKHAASQLIGVLRGKFPQGIDLDPGKTLEVGAERVPVLKSGGIVVNNNFAQVDELTRETGNKSVGTIFVRRGDEFVRISTSLKKEDGSRAVGTRLDHNHPAYAALLENRDYTGRAHLFGSDYMTRYNPFTDKSGAVIGVYFIGFDITEPMRELKDLIREIKILKSGYAFVIDSSGNAVVHPTQEGHNILAAKDGDGRDIIRELANVKSGVVNYSWINKELGETWPRQKIAVLDYYQPWDWIIATTSYTDELYSELRSLRNVLFMLSILGAAVVSLIAYLAIRSTLSPVTTVSEAMQRIGQGDATREVDPRLCERTDEIGTLAAATNAMSTSLRGLLRDISQSVVSLSGASSKLTDVSGQTARGVAKVSEKATMVAAAAEEASANTSGVAKSVGEATTNLQSVSDATAQLSTTIADIAASSEKARGVSNQASSHAKSASSIMLQLGRAAKNISRVTESITKISAQTNLLALNATIEAARAGAAGKGFAVVAGEIKELAQQTAVATEDIRTTISDIQSSVGSATSDIDGVANVIGDVEQLVSSIAAAIEEQSAVTKDLAGNIAQASAEMKNAGEQVSQTATVSISIAQEIAALSLATTEIRDGGALVETSAVELQGLATQLGTLAARFKT